MVSENLPYRPCVGVMLLNADNKVWVGRRFDTPNADEGPSPNGDGWWQMPQGGIDKGEEPAAAALRELFEETSVRSAEIIAEAPDWFTYDLPQHLVGKAWKGRYRGQKQRWFAARFTGNESEIDIAAPAGHKAEFDQWRWVDMSELVDMIIPFKRHVYKQVVEAFADIT
ncbi:MAG: RNA pyrophosphohydrolase [Hyphomicrobiaceae bacterium]